MYKQSPRAFLRLSEKLIRELKPRELGSLSYKQLIVPQKVLPPVKNVEKINFHISCENYAKSRDKKKEKKKSTKVDENELNEYFEVEKLMSDISRPLDIFREELIKHATLRSTAGVVEGLPIKLEDGVYKIQDLAQVGKKNPRLIILDFSSFPAAIPAVLSAFEKSELNINVQQEGTKLFVPIPKVTKTHREVLAKKCRLYFVKCKEGIRDVQMKYIKKLGSIDKLSVEEKFRMTDQLTALGNKQIQIAEGMMKEKQEELLKLEDIS